MKKLTTLAVVMIVVTMSALANTGKEKKAARKAVAIEQTGNEQFNLQVMAEAPGSVDVKIYTERGRLIHKDQYKFKKSFKVPFDLSSLKEGNYRFVVEGSDIAASQEVFVSKLHQQDVAVFFQPLDDHKVKVTIYHEDTPVFLSLEDENGRTYFEERLLGTQNYTQLFDLSEVRNKELQMVVKGRKSTIRKVL